MSYLATSGGPHPADKLAAQVAQQIGGLIAIDENSGSDDAAAARKQKPRLILDIADAVEKHYADIMAAERAELAKGPARLSAPLNSYTPQALSAAVAAVAAAAKGTVFEPHFATQPVLSAVSSIIEAWFATAVDIERDWVAKGHRVGRDGKAAPNPNHNPSNQHVAAWHARRAGKAA